MYVANAIKFNNQMFTLPGHPGENSTYNLQFRGPHFECITSQYNITLRLDYSPREDLKVPVFISAWDRERLTYSLRQHMIGNYALQHNPNGSLLWTAYSKRIEQICEAKSALYNVSITFPRGVQTVNYSLSEVKSALKQTDLLGTDLEILIELPPGTQVLESWYQRLATAIPMSNEWAILDALGTLIEGTCTQQLSIPELLPPSSGYPPPETPTGANGQPACIQGKGSSGANMFYDCGSWLGYEVSKAQKDKVDCCIN